MGFIDALFSTASTASTVANSTSKIIKEEHKVRGAKEKLPYADVIDGGSYILLRVDSSGCETKVSFISRPLPSDHTTLVSNAIKFKRTARKAEDGVKYISRGIVPEDTVDVLSIKDEHTFYPIEDIESVTKPDPKDNSIHLIKLKKVVPTYEATF